MNSRAIYLASLFLPGPNQEWLALCHSSNTSFSALGPCPSGPFPDSFLVILFFSMGIDFYLATPDLESPVQASPEFQAHPCTLAGPDGSISTSNLCPPSIPYFSCIGERHFYISYRKNLRVPWNFPVSLAFSVKSADRLSHLHFLQHLNQSIFLFPSLP